MSQPTIGGAAAKLIEEIKAVVAEAEQLLGSVDDEGGENSCALGSRVKLGLDAARRRLHEIEDSLADNAGAAGLADDDYEYVYEYPWGSIGVFAGLGLTGGFLLGLMLNRR